MTDEAPGWQRLDARVIDLDRAAGAVVAAIFAVVLLLGAGVIWLVPTTPLWLQYLSLPVLALVIAALVWSAVWWPAIDYRYRAYRVLGDRLEIREGVIVRTVIVVPRVRVQHIDVSQGPFERRFGLATLSVYTAGTDFSRVNLRGLAHGEAMELRDRLLPADTPDGV